MSIKKTQKQNPQQNPNQQNPKNSPFGKFTILSGQYNFFIKYNRDFYWNNIAIHVHSSYIALIMVTSVLHTEEMSYCS